MTTAMFIKKPKRLRRLREGPLRRRTCARRSHAHRRASDQPHRRTLAQEPGRWDSRRRQIRSLRRPAEQPALDAYVWSQLLATSAIGRSM